MSQLSSGTACTDVISKKKRIQSLLDRCCLVSKAATSLCFYSKKTLERARRMPMGCQAWSLLDAMLSLPAEKVTVRRRFIVGGRSLYYAPRILVYKTGGPLV
jgi:hypothetical protein